ncbi:MAG: patatin-like phospholipase family protein [Chloroflexi bacterium]|nr:patatin-like phospholipase family protein [Chloroflexota bacterium]
MIEVALALGGGGIKGLAHIGVIRCLEKEGFKIKAIAGTSAGGLIGAAYATGVPLSELEDLVIHVNQAHLFTRSITDGPGLMGLQGLTTILAEFLGQRHFSDLAIPFACTAVDIHTAQEIILNQGYVLDALLATIAMPGVFPPKELYGMSLVDGGVLDPVPVALARWLAPGLPVVAVCLSPKPEGWVNLSPIRIPAKPPIHIPIAVLEQFSRLRIAQAFNIFIKSMDITSRMLAETRMQIEKPDVIIRPEVEKFGVLDEVNASELVNIGEQSVAAALSALANTHSVPNRILRRFRRASLPGKTLVDAQHPAEEE